MPMKNKIKAFLDKNNLTAYRFIKDTGLSETTGYRLATKGVIQLIEGGIVDFSSKSGDYINIYKKIIINLRGK